MFKERFFPFTAAPKPTKSGIAPSIKEPDPKGLIKVFKVRALGLGFDQGLSAYYLQNKKRAAFEEPPYDLDKILQAIDTDSYIKQAFNKYKELFWKEGWEIVGENSDAVDYIWQRIDLFELVMKKPWQEFLTEIADQLVKFHNAFIVVARGNIRPYFKGKLYTREGQDPISGFYLLPTEKVRILRDKFNKPIAYKQELDDVISDDNQDPIWDADQVIHLYLDRKPGRAFGTPFLISALDDVVALRQLEEDIQNLAHQQLFPLYKYKIGTEDRPATKEEIEDAYDELENLRGEGGLILPERHDVEVIGAEGSALDVGPYLAHFKERVCVGLGVSSHHLGMMSSGGNRSVTDRLDIALYDKVKSYQRYVEDILRMHFFNPILIEGGFDPYMPPTDKESISDLCLLKFKEIDKDTQVKVESHEINKFAQNAITWEELRMKLGENVGADPDNLLMSMTHKLDMKAQGDMAKLNAELQPKSTTTSKSPTGAVSKKIVQPVKPDAAKPSTGGSSNKPNTTKGLGNLMKPSNQFGRRTSPNIRHSDDDIFISELIDDLVQLIEEKEEQ